MNRVISILSMSLLLLNSSIVAGISINCSIIKNIINYESKIIIDIESYLI